MDGLTFDQKKDIGEFYSVVILSVPRQIHCNEYYKFFPIDIHDRLQLHAYLGLHSLYFHWHDNKLHYIDQDKILW